MKYIFSKIKNLIPYLLLIAIYFFFVNLEARNIQTKNTKGKNKEKEFKYDKPSLENPGSRTGSRISIPVIPFKD